MRATTKFAICLVIGLTVSAEPAVAQSVWATSPTEKDFAEVYPKGANGAGWARVECMVAPSGTLSLCRVVEESSGGGFGAAALRLASKFRATPDSAVARAGTLRMRIEIPVPSEPQWRDARFKTDRTYAHLGMPGPYFPDKAYRARMGGIVVMDCHVDAKLRLNDCELRDANPEGWGFEEAALAMARQRWMTAAELPLEASEPVDGVWRFRVDFPRPSRGP